MKKAVVLNFSHYALSETAMKQLNGPSVLHIPLSVTTDMDLTEYVETILDGLQLKPEDSESVIYLVVPPGLNILTAIICRRLGEMIPYQIVNLIRSQDRNEFIVQDVY